MNNKKIDIEERLIDFAALIIAYVNTLPDSIGANHLGGQLLRSGTSPALNYGEARGAESKKDFIHKMKICLKELRESFNCLKILLKAKLYIQEDVILKLISECNELIAIFVVSLKTATNPKLLNS